MDEIAPNGRTYVAHKKGGLWINRYTLESDRLA